MKHGLLRVLLIVVSLSCLSACGAFSGSSKVREPTELEKISPRITPQRLWRVNTGKGADDEFIRLPFLVTSERIVTIDHRGLAAAFDKATGAKLWANDTESTIYSGINGNDVLAVFGTDEGALVALSVVDGSQIWSVQLSSEVTAVSPVVDDMFVVRTKNGYIHAISSADGEKLWSINRESPDLSLHTQSVPLIVGDLVLVGLDNGEMLALAKKDGKVKWERAAASGRGRTELDRMVDIDGRFEVRDDVLYVVTYQGNAVAANLEAGEFIWSHEASSVNGLALGPAHVFYTDSDDRVVAREIGLGEQIWAQESFLYRNLSAPAVVANYVMAGDLDGYLHWLDQNDGTIVGRSRVAGAVHTAPVSEGERVYILDSKGELSAWTVPAG